MDAQHLTVARTARYHTLGTDHPVPREIWLVCHGYGQLAERFLRGFQPIADGTRWIVAPEALSRFYLESAPSGEHGDRVGASWMTREDREHEILDIVRYLDAVHDRVQGAAGGGPRPLRALGFSQGGAAVARWTARGRALVDELVLWGSLLPPDVLPPAAAPPWPRCRVTFVLGSEDPHLDPAAAAQQADHLESLGCRASVVTFAGGHHLDPATLQALVK